MNPNQRKRKLRKAKKTIGETDEKAKDVETYESSESSKGNKIIILKGKRTKPLNELKKAIEKLGFREIEISKDVMTVKIVERETIKGRPYLYMILTFEPDQLSIEYNIPKDYSKPLREFEVASLLLRVLLLTESYKVEPNKVYKIMFNVFSTVHDILTNDYIKLKGAYDNLAEEYRKLKAKLSETQKINEKINKTMLEIEKRNQELSERIKNLESVSDETLEEMIIDWLRTNRGSINVYTFSKINNIPPARVEEGLDILMKKGVIERIK